MTPELIATDIDGTLLDDDEKVTARTRSAVHAAVSAGVQFVLATGRPVDPLGDRVGTHERLTALRSAGATAVTCTVSAQSAEHYCDQLGALSEVAAEITEEAM